jgi:hypothetical protein
VLDGLTLRVLQGVIGAGDAVTEDPRIDRPTGVDVLLAEEALRSGFFSTRSSDGAAPPGCCACSGALDLLQEVRRMMAKRDSAVITAITRFMEHSFE